MGRFGILDTLRIPGKVVGWSLSIVGLLILAEPSLNTGIFSTTVSATMGMAVMFVGIAMIVGIPSLNKIWDQIEYGYPALIFIVGLSLLYIQTNSWDAFLQLLQKYTVFGFVTGIVVTALEVFLKGGDA